MGATPGNPTSEGIKELLRTLVLAVLPVLASYLTNIKQNSATTTLVVIGGTAVLSGIDKWIHKNGDTKLNGLVPF